MPNYYTEFSTGIHNLTETELEWIRQMFDFEGWSHDWVDIEQSETVGHRLAGLTGLPEDAFDDDYYWPVFEYEIQERPGDTELWMHSIEAQLMPTASFIQVFLRKFRPHQAFTLSYAKTCHRPVEDAFGGGTALITAQEIHWFDGDVLAFDLLNELGMEA